MATASTAPFWAMSGNGPNDSSRPAIPMVQGQVVQSTKNSTPLQPAKVYDTGGSINKPGQSNAPFVGKNNYYNRKTRKCQDVLWAILFYAHLAGIAYCTYAYVPAMVQAFLNADNGNSDNNAAANDDGGNADGGGDDGGGRRLVSFATKMVHRHIVRRFLEEAEDDGGGGGQEQDDDDEDLQFLSPRDLSILLCLSAVMGLVVSGLSMGLMISFAQALIRIALLFNVVLFGVMAVVAALAGNLTLAAMCAVLLAASGFYTCKVWPRIPFAASNLVTSVTAVRANIGLALYAFLGVVLIVGWTLWWSVAASATLFVVSGCDAQGNCEQEELNGGLVFAFLLSYYWTIQVLANVVHVTTAGTVGTWWFCPSEANGCCSLAVRQSYMRAMSLQFGSICLASLLVALVQAVREMVHYAREHGEGDAFIACCAECCLACLEYLVETFNRFALIYCAIHGQSFLEAGKCVMDLFKHRGWTAIVADLMVDTVLWMVTIGVALITGILTVVIASALQMELSGVDAQESSTAAVLGVAFGVGFLVGYSMCSVLFGVVSSACNTVVVLYAEAPNDFQQNHKELATQMHNAWKQAWPNEFSY